MSKVTYQQKVVLLDRYAKRPMAVSDVEVIAAIRADVVRAATKGVKKGSETDPRETEAYNKCMGIYREFLKSRDSYLDMTGRKAAINSQAMRNIMKYIRDFARSNGRPHEPENVVAGVKLIFDNWDNLSDFHRKRIALPDIYHKIEEIIPQIKNGHDKQSAQKIQLDVLEARIRSKGQGD